MEHPTVGQTVSELDPLSTFRELDLKVGLASTGQNRALYLRLLKKFVAKERSFASDCAAMIAAGETPAAMRRAHDLRSTGGALGALNVSVHAHTFECALRDGASAEELKILLQAVEESLAPLLSELAHLQ